MLIHVLNLKLTPEMHLYMYFIQILRNNLNYVQCKMSDD